MKFELKNRKFE